MQDLALVGVGLRSNFEACQQLMDEDLLGVRRLAVVRDEFEMHQVNSPSEIVAASAYRAATSRLSHTAAYRHMAAGVCKAAGQQPGCILSAAVLDADSHP